MRECKQKYNYSRTNSNKINSMQKYILAEYMSDHPKLAKNLLPSTSQGKAASNIMWETLTRKLNAAGPPTKIPRLWKKVFADQKFHTKKKLFFNKVSHKEKMLTEEEQLIIEATGLDATVEDLVGVPKVGNSKFTVLSKSTQDDSDKCPLFEESIHCVFEEHLVDDDSDLNREFIPTTSIPTHLQNHNSTGTDPKLQILEHYLSEKREHNKRIETKLDRIIQIQERFLALKEEKHQISLALQRVELEIKTIQLKQLKTKSRKRD